MCMVTANQMFNQLSIRIKTVIDELSVLACQPNETVCLIYI